MRLRLLAASLLPLFLAGCLGVPDGVTVVRGFQTERYLGTWYEIARLDHRFERGMVDVTAQYSMREDGGIRVLNRGFALGDGEWAQAEGRAYPVGESDVGALKVSFFGPFYGAYNVIALDPEYRWAMVVGPDTDYLWILAREPELPESVVQPLLDQARAAGFAVDGLIWPQRDTARYDLSAER